VIVSRTFAKEREKKKEKKKKREKKKIKREGLGEMVEKKDTFKNVMSDSYLDSL